MSIKSTIYKAQLQIANIDEAYYADHALTLARHPSETDERMMVKLLAFAHRAHEVQSLCNGDGRWEFGAGLSDPDSPDLYLEDFSGIKRSWVEVGQPDEKPLAKACSQSDSASVYAFHHAQDVWWKTLQNKVSRLDKLQVWSLDHVQTQALADMAQRSMQFQITVLEQVITFSSAQASLSLEPKRLK